MVPPPPRFVPGTSPTPAMVPLPVVGRAYTARRPVRLSDVSPHGRMRLDAMARFVQDVSNDDTVDAGLVDDMAWVVRRTVIEVHVEARLREQLTLTTFCGGTGSRWAERRVSARGEHGAHIETSTVWVHLDMATGRPRRLPEQFHQIYGEAAGGRTVRANLHHDPAPPPGFDARSPWPLRFSDLDVLDHVNNTVAWAAVEEARAGRQHLRAPLRAEVEYREPIEHHDAVELVAVDGVAVDGSEGEVGMDLWLVDATTPERVFVTAQLRSGDDPVR